MDNPLIIERCREGDLCPNCTALRGLLAAAEKVYSDLSDRIITAKPDAVPVFYGMADLHAAIAACRPTGVERGEGS